MKIPSKQREVAKKLYFGKVKKMFHNFIFYNNEFFLKKMK